MFVSCLKCRWQLLNLSEFIYIYIFYNQLNEQAIFKMLIIWNCYSLKKEVKMINFFADNFSNKILKVQFNRFWFVNHHRVLNFYKWILCFCESFHDSVKKQRKYQSIFNSLKFKSLLGLSHMNMPMFIIYEHFQGWFFLIFFLYLILIFSLLFKIVL